MAKREEHRSRILRSHGVRQAHSRRTTLEPEADLDPPGEPSPALALRGSQRLSLVRTIGAVLWIASDSGSGAYTLACEFDHAFGTPKTYAALAELETWAGGGGATVVSPACASGSATPRNVTVTLMR